MLEVLDRKILRAVLGAHSKVLWEVLYLETAVLPISNVITARRQWNQKKVYTAQKSDPSKGDWINIVQDDMRMIGLDISDQEIEEMNIEKYSDKVKKKTLENMLYKSLNPYRRDTRR